MADPTTLTTARLVLRPWRDSDREAFAEMNADARVMEFFPSVLTREVSDGWADTISQRLIRQGWGLWAVEIPDVVDFAGFIGLNPDDALGYPSVEIGWRLAFSQWGHGYATEGAKAALEFGFNTLRLDEVVSFTTVSNHRSRRVMEKLGLVHDPNDDFDHPRVPADSPLRRHVVYRLKRSQYLGQQTRLKAPYSYGSRDVQPGYESSPPEQPWGRDPWGDAD